MRFTSLANPADNVSFQEALAYGLPKDPGSLYVPEFIPQLSSDDVEQLIGADPVEIGKTMLRPFVSDEIAEADLHDIVSTAITFPTPLVNVGDKQVFELWHGPAMAFKDVAARYVGSFMSYYNGKTGRESMVLVATSGDTGDSMAEGLADMKGVELVVAYPKGRVSKFQQERLRRAPDNVHTVEVDGTFNDCVKFITAAFADPELREGLHLTSANSTNVGRLLPQTTYWASIYSQLGGDPARKVTPSGNLGNLSAGVLTDAMGVPLSPFLGAFNANDVWARYRDTGYYTPTETIPTIASAMDVNDPRNKPRLDWLFGDDMKRMRAAIQAVRVSDNEVIDTIQKVNDETGYVLDPHTAVAWRASDMMEKDDSQLTDVIISTASSLKFADEIFRATGIEVDDSAALAEARKRPERYTEINHVEDFLEFLETVKSSVGS